MRLEKYELEADSTRTVFDFVSESPKGRILKRVYYTKVKLKGFRNLYNIALGDKIEGSDEIDDLVVTNNQDREKVLATVAATVILFTKRHPKAQIFIRGSSPSRTRLYQIAIGKYFDELSDIFDIKGFINDDFYPFEKNKDYFSFLIIRKTR
jgi:hypothetical protein